MDTQWCTHSICFRLPLRFIRFELRCMTCAYFHVPVKAHFCFGCCWLAGCVVSADAHTKAHTDDKWSGGGGGRRRRRSVHACCARACTPEGYAYVVLFVHVCECACAPTIVCHNGQPLLNTFQHPHAHTQVSLPVRACVRFNSVQMMSESNCPLWRFFSSSLLSSPCGL